MNELQIALKIALANVYVMAFKSQSYHWNVEGILFSQYHTFFGDLYNALFGSIDDLAERIRTIDGFAPFSIMDTLSAATATEDVSRPISVQQMISNLLVANAQVTQSLNKAFDLAGSNEGLKNLLADRLDVHGKYNWQLRVALKSIGV